MSLAEEYVDGNGFGPDGLWASDRTKRVFQYLRQVQSDLTQTPSAVVLAFVLVDKYVNADGIAWPSQERLAKDLRITSRGVRKLLDGLVGGGHLLIRSGKGRKITSTYSPQLWGPARPTNGAKRPGAGKQRR